MFIRSDRAAKAGVSGPATARPPNAAVFPTNCLLFILQVIFSSNCSFRECYPLFIPHSHAGPSSPYFTGRPFIFDNTSVILSRAIFISSNVPDIKIRPDAPII